MSYNEFVEDGEDYLRDQIVDGENAPNSDDLLGLIGGQATVVLGGYAKDHRGCFAVADMSAFIRALQSELAYVRENGDDDAYANADTLESMIAVNSKHIGQERDNLLDIAQGWVAYLKYIAASTNIVVMERHVGRVRSDVGALLSGGEDRADVWQAIRKSNEWPYALMTGVAPPADSTPEARKETLDRLSADEIKQRISAHAKLVMPDGNTLAAPQKELLESGRRVLGSLIESDSFRPVLEVACIARRVTCLAKLFAHAKTLLQGGDNANALAADFLEGALGRLANVQWDLLDADVISRVQGAREYAERELAKTIDVGRKAIAGKSALSAASVLAVMYQPYIPRPSPRVAAPAPPAPRVVHPTPLAPSSSSSSSSSYVHPFPSSSPSSSTPVHEPPVRRRTVITDDTRDTPAAPERPTAGIITPEMGATAARALEAGKTYKLAQRNLGAASAEQKLAQLPNTSNKARAVADVHVRQAEGALATAARAAAAAEAAAAAARAAAQVQSSAPAPAARDAPVRLVSAAPPPATRFENSTSAAPPSRPIAPSPPSVKVEGVPSSRVAPPARTPPTAPPTHQVAPTPRVKVEGATPSRAPPTAPPARAPSAVPPLLPASSPPRTPFAPAVKAEPTPSTRVVSTAPPAPQSAHSSRVLSTSAKVEGAPPPRVPSVAPAPAVKVEPAAPPARPVFEVIDLDSDGDDGGGVTLKRGLPPGGDPGARFSAIPKPTTPTFVNDMGIGAVSSIADAAANAALDALMARLPSSSSSSSAPRPSTVSRQSAPSSAVAVAPARIRVGGGVVLASPTDATWRYMSLWKWQLQHSSVRSMVTSANEIEALYIAWLNDVASAPVLQRDMPSYAVDPTPSVRRKSFETKPRGARLAEAISSFAGRLPEQPYPDRMLTLGKLRVYSPRIASALSKIVTAATASRVPDMPSLALFVVPASGIGDARQLGLYKSYSYMYKMKNTRIPRQQDVDPGYILFNSLNWRETDSFQRACTVVIDTSISQRNAHPSGAFPYRAQQAMARAVDEWYFPEEIPQDMCAARALRAMLMMPTSVQVRPTLARVDHVGPNWAPEFPTDALYKLFAYAPLFFGAAWNGDRVYTSITQAQEGVNTVILRSSDTWDAPARSITTRVATVDPEYFIDPLADGESRFPLDVWIASMLLDRWQRLGSEERGVKSFFANLPQDGASRAPPPRSGAVVQRGAFAPGGVRLCVPLEDKKHVVVTDLVDANVCSQPLLTGTNQRAHSLLLYDFESRMTGELVAGEMYREWHMPSYELADVSARVAIAYVSTLARTLAVVNPLDPSTFSILRLRTQSVDLEPGRVEYMPGEIGDFKSLVDGCNRVNARIRARFIDGPVVPLVFTPTEQDKALPLAIAGYNAIAALAQVHFDHLSDIFPIYDIFPMLASDAVYATCMDAIALQLFGGGDVPTILYRSVRVTSANAPILGDHMSSNFDWCGNTESDPRSRSFASFAYAPCGDEEHSCVAFTRAMCADERRGSRLHPRAAHFARDSLARDIRSRIIAHGQRLREDTTIAQLAAHVARSIGGAHAPSFAWAVKSLAALQRHIELRYHLTVLRNLSAYAGFAFAGAYDPTLFRQMCVVRTEQSASSV